MYENDALMENDDGRLLYPAGENTANEFAVVGLNDVEKLVYE